MSYPSSHLSPYLGALELQFAHGPFYTFVILSLMVLYQLESLHLDDYNLIYRQNKNRGFYKILIAFPLKTQHFPFLQTLHKTNPNQSQPTIQNNLNTIPKLIYNQNKTLFIHNWGFPQLKHKNKGVWVYFLPQPLQIFSSKLFDLLGARDGKKTQPKLDLLQNPSFSPFSPLFFSQKWDLLK